ncbi:hypothetical protein OF829_04675 [Sphingomonas sp. LB-2]|uniref:hypothetical protein n=1 Tax=Sphingomonas caeni TaxID=2984949 RepID=UPI0022305D9E|nr:hypothetical protein [Sphingomonas caeni]MCW3846522.1 hypothetical protein [Sphingomonas caeni]
MSRLLALSVLASAALLLAGCNPAAPPPANNDAAALVNEAEPAAPPHLADTAPLPAGGLSEWLVGTWSFEKECASDFVVHYNADGSVDNSGDVGTWKVADGKITETITERGDLGGEAAQKVNPPEVRSFAVERIDQNHGVVTSPFNGKKVPILRC